MPSDELPIKWALICGCGMARGAVNIRSTFYLPQGNIKSAVLFSTPFTYRMTPQISPAYMLSNVVSFVTISPGFYVLIRFYYVVFLSSVILQLFRFLLFRATVSTV